MFKCARLISLFAAIVLFAGCKTNYRLHQRFDTEPVNSPPMQFPPPDPPADDLTWSKQLVNCVVLPRPGGGRWVRVQAGPIFQQRGTAGALLAFTDYFDVDVNKNVRGHFTVRLDGPGRAWIALRALQTNTDNPGSWLGGYSIRNGLGSADVAFLRSNDLEGIISRQDWWRMGSVGTYLTPYTPGSAIDLFWSIDQSNRNLVLSAQPGETTQVDYPAVTPAGVSNAPLRRMWIQIFIHEFTPDTQLFLDDITVEQFQR